MRNIGRAIDIEQVKDEIRNLNRIDKNEIWRWIDEEAATDLLLRIAVPANRTEAEWHPKRRETPESSAMSDWYAYQGPFIHFVHYGAYPPASKDDILIGIYKTFDEAEEAALLRRKLRQSEK